MSSEAKNKIDQNENIRNIFEKVKNGQPISRREFILLIPYILKIAGIGTIISLAAKYGIKISEEEISHTLKPKSKQDTQQEKEIETHTYPSLSVNQNLPSQPTLDSIEFRNLETYEQVNSNEYLVSLARELRYLYSPKKSEISPLITNMVHGSLPNFDQMPEIIEARKLPNIQERILAIIKILGVNTQEELKLLDEINNLEQKIQQINKEQEVLFLKLSELEDLYSKEEIKKNQDIYNLILSLRDEYIGLGKQVEDYEAKISLIEKEISKNAGNPAWNDEVISFCNLYATTLLAALGLFHRISHRVDENGNPVENGGRELNAGGMFNWFREHGSRFGWRDVTDLTHKERMELLRNGAIFYGSSIEHNWIIFGMDVNGFDFRPILTQATDNRSLGLFPNITDGIKDRSLITSWKNSMLKLEYLYKIFPTRKSEKNDDDYQLWAIFVDDSKNPPVRK